MDKICTECNTWAHSVTCSHFEQKTGQATSDGAGKNPDAVRLGRLGGLKRAQNLTKEQRFLIAQKAGKNRWGKKDTVKVKMEGPASQ